MNEKFVLEMKERLEKELAQLLKDLSGFAEQDPKAQRTDFVSKFPEYGDDQGENANEVATYSNNLALEDKLEKEVRDIKNAIDRIKKNKYGGCKYCETDITEDRLRARPTSTSCVACKKTLTQEL